MVCYCKVNMNRILTENARVFVMSTKKLIEVALPLEKINAESAREKSIRHGHPSTLHLWWARRPLALTGTPDRMNETQEVYQWQ